MLFSHQSTPLGRYTPRVICTNDPRMPGRWHWRDHAQVDMPNPSSSTPFASRQGREPSSIEPKIMVSDRKLHENMEQYFVVPFR